MNTATWTPEDVDHLGVRCTVEQAASLLGMSRAAAYLAISQERFPVPVIKVTRRHWIVPTAPLRRLLHLTPNDTEDPPGSESSVTSALDHSEGENLRD